MKADSNNNKVAHPLNQILYGPPGTGKTWQTVNYAIAIIENKNVEDIEGEDRTDIKEKFEELKRRGLVEMVTFHQSFTYEDFVEGIKPKLDQNELVFKIEDGIFKRICNRAAVDIGLLLDAFAEYVQEKAIEGEGNEVRLDNEKWTIKGADSTTFYLRDTQITLSRSMIEKEYLNYQLGNIKTPSDIPPGRDSQLPEHRYARYYIPLFKTLEHFCNSEYQQNYKKIGNEYNVEITNRNKFVLIVDEINRGNIAKIFGELITLIEDSKRFGAEDEASVTLPYSKETFSIPSNVYIIGTMNTADRSIALLDTALRRRFDFREMMPDIKHKDISTNVSGIDLKKLLKIMNQRIAVLLDREHQIGHTYFLKVKECEKLKIIFQKKIIPLLQEYFYDNWEKIDLVLNRNGFVVEVKSDKLFEDNNDDLFDSGKKIYNLLDSNSKVWEKEDNYISIYEPAGDKGESK